MQQVVQLLPCGCCCWPLVQAAGRLQHMGGCLPRLRRRLWLRLRLLLGLLLRLHLLLLLEQPNVQPSCKLFQALHAGPVSQGLLPLQKCGQHLLQLLLIQQPPHPRLLQMLLHPDRQGAADQRLQLLQQLQRGQQALDLLQPLPLPRVCFRSCLRRRCTVGLRLLLLVLLVVLVVVVVLVLLVLLLVRWDIQLAFRGLDSAVRGQN